MKQKLFVVFVCSLFVSSVFHCDNSNSPEITFGLISDIQYSDDVSLWHLSLFDGGDGLSHRTVGDRDYSRSHGRRESETCPYRLSRKFGALFHPSCRPRFAPPHPFLRPKPNANVQELS